LTPDELLTLIDEGHPPAILDVRSAWEYKRGHVPGAVHIPFWKVGTRLDELPPGKNEELVVYCGHGPRAWRAGGILRRHGFKNITYLKGHMHSWRQAGLREEKEG
jgi:rhodanese-related sulfurtransferase